MDWKVVGFLATMFVGFTLINLVMGGAFISGSDIDAIQSLTLMKTYDVFGQFSIPVPNLDFFFTGLPRLITWDYSFFGGNAGIIVYLLYSVTAAVSFGLLITIVGMLVNGIRR